MTKNKVKVFTLIGAAGLSLPNSSLHAEGNLSTCGPNSGNSCVTMSLTLRDGCDLINAKRKIQEIFYTRLVLGRLNAENKIPKEPVFISTEPITCDQDGRAHLLLSKKELNQLAADAKENGSREKMEDEALLRGVVNVFGDFSHTVSSISEKSICNKIDPESFGAPILAQIKFQDQKSLQQVHEVLDDLIHTYGEIPSALQGAFIDEFQSLTESCLKQSDDDKKALEAVGTKDAKPTSKSESGNHSSKHIVFDLDGTLISDLSRPTNSSAQNPNIISISVLKAGKRQTESYRLLDYVPEVLSLLSRYPGLELSYFSGGTNERNSEVLKKIQLTSGLTAYAQAHSILSVGDLTKLSNEATYRNDREANGPAHAPSTQKAIPFSQANKKDLVHLRKFDQDLNDVILVDDIPGFSYQGQSNEITFPVAEKTTLLSFEDFSVVKEELAKYEAVKAAYDAEKRKAEKNHTEFTEREPRRPGVPQNLLSYIENENRITGVFGLIKNALHLSTKNKISLGEALKLIDKPFNRSRYIEEGLAALTGHELYEDTNPCTQRLKSYLRRKEKFAIANRYNSPSKNVLAQ